MLGTLRSVSLNELAAVDMAGAAHLLSLSPDSLTTFNNDIASEKEPY